jgi:hypothetical protein
VSGEAHKDKIGLAPGECAEAAGAEEDPQTALYNTKPLDKNSLRTK